ncbi:MAG: SPOR domain-containing protein [Deltaproteobacteria bacterium]
MSQAPELPGFTIQVSAVEDRQMALMEAERLKGLGFPTVSIEEALMENRKWFFVNLGYFQNEKKAFTLASRLQKKGMLSSFLIRKSESQVHEED